MNLADADERLDRFYRLLVLWGYLQPTPENGSQTKSSTKLDSSQCSSPLQWRTFLDALCWLGDPELGGKTVTSICAEGTGAGPKYWLACNKKVKHGVVEHLKWTLDTCNGLDGADRDEKDEVETKIVRRSVEFSARSAQEYYERLSGFVTDVLKQHPYLGSILKQFQIPGQDLFVLTESAFDFRNTNGKQLLRAAAGRDHMVAKVYHHIGRLGSWRDAAKSIVLLASAWPEAVRNFTIAPLSDSEYPRHPIDDLSILKVINDVLPDLKKTLTKNDWCLLRRLGGEDIADKFSGMLRAAKPNARLHAEVIIAEDFYLNDKSFWGGYRYIGCRNFDARPYHGTAYSKWLPPRLFKQRDNEDSMHNLEILGKITVTLEADIRQQIQAKRPRKGRIPDSATSMSTNLMASMRL